MSTRIITRRQMLRGASGFALGLPLLPSLLPGRAYGQEAVFAAPRFLAMTTEHGGVFESAMFPDPSSLTDTQSLYPGHSIRYGALQRAVEGADAVVSTVLRGPADRLSARLAAKMNVLFGLDIPFYIAHHTGGHLGNYARNDGNGAEGKQVQPYFMPTIDQLMAWSPTFYDDLTSVSLRAIVTGSRDRLSWNWSNPSARTGAVEEVRNTRDAREVFDQLFSAGSMPAQPTRRSIVDRVIENYRSLRQGDRRLSTLDRQRLDDHMDRLAELQRRADALSQARAACNEPTAPAYAGDDPANMALLVDVIANAFICGASRIAVLGVVDQNFVDFDGDWHQDVAHKWSEPQAQSRLQQSNSAAFREVFLALAARLDAVEESPGVSVLDNTLMTWSQESGEATHEARAIPVVTFGSAGNFLRTGLFCDYRNTSSAGMRKGEDAGYSGLLYSQWLATCLQAMRLPASEWQNVEHNGAAGYGYPLIDQTYAPTHARGVVENASEVLPQLTA